MNRTLLAGLAAWLIGAWAFAEGNLVLNGGFERGDKAPDSWYVKLADFMPEQTNDDKEHRSFHYKCGCGADLGDVKPWCGLLCPKCGGYISGEECGAWYLQNHERVSLDRGASGRGVKFTLPTDVGNNQGVRIFSTMIPARKGWGYKFSFDARTKGSVARVFVEGHREVPAAKSFQWDGGYDPKSPKRPLERIYRAQVNCGSPSGWEHFTKEVAAPERYQFDYLVIKLYAYMPGEAWFDNVSLTPMSPSEMRKYLADKHPKDDRFKR